jgi:hypothetical protein
MNLKLFLKIISLILIILTSTSVFGQAKFDKESQLDSTKMLGELGWFPEGKPLPENSSNEEGDIWYQVTLDKAGYVTNIILLGTTLSEVFEQKIRKNLWESKYIWTYSKLSPPEVTKGRVYIKIIER